MYQTIVPITKSHLGKTHNRPTSKLTKALKIVIHYTANSSAGATAMANRNYYNTTTNYASTQYICDSESIVECMPWYEVSWAVGASSYTSFGNSLRSKIGYKTPNYCTVNIEMCVNSSGDWHKTVMNTVSCVTHLLLNCCTDLDVSDVVRHFDITGKCCPAMYLKDADWKEFLDIIKTSYEAAKQNKQPQFNYWTTKAAEITTDGLNIRKGPGADWQAVGKYNTKDVATIYEETNGWYRTDKGWISGSYMKVIEKSTQPPTVDPDKDEPSISLDRNPVTGVTVAALNCRTTYSTGGKVVMTYPKGTRITLLEDKNGWYRTDKGWVSGKYIDLDDSATRKIVTANHQLEVCYKDGKLLYRHVSLNVPFVVFPNDTIMIGSTKAIACSVTGHSGYIKELYTVK